MENLDRINELIKEKKYEDAKKELIGIISDEEKDVEALKQLWNIKMMQQAGFI